MIDSLQEIFEFCTRRFFEFGHSARDFQFLHTSYDITRLNRTANQYICDPCGFPLLKLTENVRTESTPKSTEYHSQYSTRDGMVRLPLVLWSLDTRLGTRYLVRYKNCNSLAAILESPRCSRFFVAPCCRKKNAELKIQFHSLDFSWSHYLEISFKNFTQDTTEHRPTITSQP